MLRPTTLTFLSSNRLRIRIIYIYFISLTFFSIDSIYSCLQLIKSHFIPLAVFNSADMIAFYSISIDSKFIPLSVFSRYHSHSSSIDSEFIIFSCLQFYSCLQLAILYLYLPITVVFNQQFYTLFCLQYSIYYLQQIARLLSLAVFSRQ